jgi:hypothetical protein
MALVPVAVERRARLDRRESINRRISIDRRLIGTFLADV